MQLRREVAGLGCTAMVYRDTEWQEFVVKFYTHIHDETQYHEGADYHTNDLDDAVETANTWVNNNSK